MKQTEEIKAMIRKMMAQEMENFKEAVSNGEADETASPVVYTMLQVLLAKIEAMPKVWHSIDEKADSNKSVVLYDVDGGYMSPPCRCMLGFDSMFINAMNKKYGANYTMWAYKDDLAPNKKEDLDMPADGRDKHLYRIKNRLAEFYIVAHSFDEAADEMKKRLDKADYGFFSYRTAPSIDHLAVQHFNYNNGKQSFSDSNANLIIVGD